MAILRYKGAPNEQPDEEETWDRQGLTMNPWNEEMSELNIPYFSGHFLRIRQWGGHLQKGTILYQVWRNDRWLLVTKSSV
jgi:hypothetical protein